MKRGHVISSVPAVSDAPDVPHAAAFTLRRRAWLHAVLGSVCLPVGAADLERQRDHPSSRWFREADAMRKLALSWGDQDYGAVLVMDNKVVGEGPSRVVRDGNVDAHAERVALLDAQRKLGRQDLGGAILYSTSRPCGLCEQAAARAKVARMYFGSGLEDAGQPLVRAR
jgi:tRNA(Arg) A34 adenosine deaminase TadA